MKEATLTVEQHQCGQIQIYIQTPDGTCGETDGEAQGSCDSLVSKRAVKRAPNENPG
jgi:hypothetical protein